MEPTITTTKEFLLELRKLLQHGWCKYYAAIDKYGSECSPHDPEAECYCITGAASRLIVFSGSPVFEKAMTILHSVAYKYGPVTEPFSDFTIADLMALNDRASYVDEIIYVINKAIELAQEAPARADSNS